MKIMSFSYRLLVPSPRPDRLILDCRDLPNPHRDGRLRELDGRDPKVRAWLVRQAPDAIDALHRQGFNWLLEGNVEVAFGCYGGRHRSVVLTEMLAESCREQAWQVTVEHTALV